MIIEDFYRRSPQKARKIYVFETYFLTYLSNNGYDKTKDRIVDDILKTDMLVFPINDTKK